MDDLSPEERFAELLQQDPRYRREAYAFVFEALDYTVRKCHGEEAAGDPPASRHVSGQDLLEGIRCFALESFGCLAAAVFESWGIRTLGEFARLPEAEVVSRLGQAGEELQAIARGEDPRPLIPRQPPPTFREGL
ncbi:MAG: Minf_1886 family protein, partial [Planctomycetota bacterium]